MIADRIAVMNAGRVVELGTAEQVWARPKDAYTRRLLAAIPIADGSGTLPRV
jgi:peptide/nickel transport system ATP-binding protein